MSTPKWQSSLATPKREGVDSHCSFAMSGSVDGAIAGAMQCNAMQRKKERKKERKGMGVPACRSYIDSLLIISFIQILN
jgi:hypothetical protein